jgi:hypothetical protein
MTTPAFFPGTYRCFSDHGDLDNSKEESIFDPQSLALLIEKDIHFNEVWENDFFLNCTHLLKNPPKAKTSVAN